MTPSACSLIQGLLAARLLLTGDPAAAFDRCKSLVSARGPGPLATVVRHRVTYDAPVKHFDRALSVAFVDSDDPNLVVPKAVIGADGARRILFPDHFESVARQIVLAHFLENEGVAGSHANLLRPSRDSHRPTCRDPHDLFAP